MWAVLHLIISRPPIWEISYTTPAVVERNEKARNIKNLEDIDSNQLGFEIVFENTTDTKLRI